MRRYRRRNPLAIALYVNAALLAGVLVAIVTRDGSPQFLPSALGQVQQPIAGGAGLFVMPAQLSTNQWGCYLMDVDAQTLCVYQYSPGEKQLRLMAARGFRYDRRLSNFNTERPSPSEVKALVEKEQASDRVNKSGEQSSEK